MTNAPAIDRHLSITVDAERLEYIDRLAAQLQVNRSAAIRHCIDAVRSGRGSLSKAQVEAELRRLKKRTKREIEDLTAANDELEREVDELHRLTGYQARLRVRIDSESMLGRLKQDPRLIFTPKEAAELLSLSYWSLYKFLRTGDLKSTGAGRDRRVSRDDILDFLRRRASLPDAA